MNKTFTKYVNKDPHPNVPFDEGNDPGLPTLTQVFGWGLLAAMAAILGSYWL